MSDSHEKDVLVSHCMLSSLSSSSSRLWVAASPSDKYGNGHWVDYRSDEWVAVDAEYWSKCKDYPKKRTKKKRGGNTTTGVWNDQQGAWNTDGWNAQQGAWNTDGWNDQQGARNTDGWPPPPASSRSYLPPASSSSSSGRAYRPEDGEVLWIHDKSGAEEERRRQQALARDNWNFLTHAAYQANHACISPPTHTIHAHSSIHASPHILSHTTGAHSHTVTDILH